MRGADDSGRSRGVGLRPEAAVSGVARFGAVLTGRSRWLPSFIGGAAYLAGAIWRIERIFFHYPPDRFLFSDMLIYVERAKQLLTPGFKPGIEFTSHPPGTYYL